MYNGNGSSYKPIGSGRGIPPIYIYIGIGLLILLGLWFVSSFINAGIEGYFALAAGVLLVLGNLRDLIANPYPSGANTPLLNTMIGGGLIFYFLGRGAFPPIGPIWYVPAVLLVLAAAPLMLGRASVYTAYLGMARDAVTNVRRVIGSYTRVP